MGGLEAWGSGLLYEYDTYLLPWCVPAGIICFLGRLVVLYDRKGLSVRDGAVMSPQVMMYICTVYHICTTVLNAFA